MFLCCKFLSISLTKMIFPGLLLVIASIIPKLLCFNTPIVRCRYNDRFKKVCASNGRTYESVCDYKEDKILNDPFLSIMHMGSCEELNNVPENLIPKYDFTDKGADEYLEANESTWRKKIKKTVETLLDYLKLREKKKQIPKPKREPEIEFMINPLSMNDKTKIIPKDVNKIN